MLFALDERQYLVAYTIALQVVEHHDLGCALINRFANRSGLALRKWERNSNL